jgi:hypothetical protein
MTDLIVLCADKKIQASVEAVLARPQAVGIRPVSFVVEVMVGKNDPGCFHNAHGYLAPRRSEFEHALVIFDRQWDGAPDISGAEMERTVREKLEPLWGQSGGVVVIDPELEVWAWSDSPYVDEVLGWKDRDPSLRVWLQTEGLLAPDQVKPADPKAAIEQAVVKGQRRWTAGTCKTLAGKVGLTRCQDPSFGRFKAILQRWFAPGGRS